MAPDDLMGRYLQRLGLERPTVPDETALRRLVAAHLERVPFENLDVVDGRAGTLTTEATLHKVVVRGRGGFCYELNEAFGALLAHLGFQVRRIEARVWSPVREAFGPAFDHLALVVTLPEGDLLTDVGFGDNNRAPLRLPRDAYTDPSGHYRLDGDGAGLCLLARQDRPLYTLSLEPQPLRAFEAMYRHHRSSPDSFFMQGLICTRATPAGRITLQGERLTVVEGAQRSEMTIPDRDLALEHYFGLPKEPSC